MACANITAARTAPDSDPPYTEHQCSLVAQFSGDSLFQNGWIADAPSAGCSGLDDGASICSDVHQCVSQRAREPHVGKA